MVVAVVYFLSPHPSHEGRDSRPGGWVWLGSNWRSEGEVVVVEERERMNQNQL